uniref:Uncharacterized protein n=1 Tax=Acrobeloides nanus TaxID=290746 RepID=A0A914EKR0_9BILA
MLIIYIILFVIDVCVTIGDFALTILNKKHMERKVYGKNHLSLTYQIQENMKTMQIIFPLSIAHSIAFLIFLISTTCVRQFLQKAVDPVSYLALIELCNSVVAIYTCIIPLIFFKLRKKLKPSATRIVQSGSAQTQEYFEILNKMYSKT